MTQPTVLEPGLKSMVRIEEHRGVLVANWKNSEPVSIFHAEDFCKIHC